MSVFEFFFSFYGLLLGLTVARVAGGLAGVLGAREVTRVGWLTPLLGVFVLLDISSFWIFAWNTREAIEIKYSVIYLWLAVAFAYYVAAALIFPEDPKEWGSLDEHYWARKKLILAGVFFANVVVVGHGIVHRPDIYMTNFLRDQLLYFPFLALLFFSRRYWLDVALLMWLAAFLAGGAILFAW